MGKQPFSLAEFTEIYAKVPRLNVEVVCATADGIVLTRRAIEPCKGQWHLPGGTVYFGELLHDAVARVARDELGVEVVVERLLGYIEYPQMARDGYRGWPIGLAFAVRCDAATFTGNEQSAEIRCFRSVPADTLREQAEFLRRCLAEEALAG